MKLYRAASLAAAADEPLLGDPSMRLVFIHGIHEEHKPPGALRQTWEKALLSAWDAAGLPKPDYTLEMPYYGNLLANLAERVRGAVRDMISESGISGTFTRIEHALIHEIGRRMGIDEAQHSAELAENVVRSDFAGCEWVQASSVFSNATYLALALSCCTSRGRLTLI